MLILLSLLLLAVSIVFRLFVLQIWLKAVIRLCEGRCIQAGLWLCLCIAPVNFFLGRGESFVLLYTTIMILAAIAAVWKHSRKIRRRGDGMVTITINLDERNGSPSIHHPEYSSY